MEANHQITSQQATRRPALLPEERVRWPSDAERECMRLAAELDQWCRENGWTREKNSWVAEEAVRRAWAMESEPV